MCTVSTISSIAIESRFHTARGTLRDNLHISVVVRRWCRIISSTRGRCHVHVCSIRPSSGFRKTLMPATFVFSKSSTWWRHVLALCSPTSSFFGVISCSLVLHSTLESSNEQPTRGAIKVFTLIVHCITIWRHQRHQETDEKTPHCSRAQERRITDDREQGISSLRASKIKSRAREGAYSFTNFTSLTYGYLRVRPGLNFDKSTLMSPDTGDHRMVPKPWNLAANTQLFCDRIRPITVHSSIQYPQRLPYHL